MMGLVLRSVAMLWLLSLLSAAYELQDTIHSLKEENVHLQQRLDNLTRALRDLKQLLSEHPKASEGGHGTEYLHTWREWSKHGISGETHQMLEQVFCESKLHGAAAPSLSFIAPAFLLVSLMASSLL